MQKAGEWIDVLLVLKTSVDPRNIVLDGGPRPLVAREKVFSLTFAKLHWPVVPDGSDKYHLFHHMSAITNCAMCSGVVSHKL